MTGTKTNVFNLNFMKLNKMNINALIIKNLNYSRILCLKDNGILLTLN